MQIPSTINSKVSSLTQPQSQSKSLQRSTQYPLKTKKQYIIWLLQTIKDHPHMKILLDSCVFVFLQKSFSQYYWNDISKNNLMKLLQDYIVYALAEISDNSTPSPSNVFNVNNLKYNDYEKFGKFFGTDFYKMFSQIKSLRQVAINSINYYSKFKSYKFFLLGSDNPFFEQETQQILNIIDDIKALSEKDPSPLFYLSAYIVRCWKMAQKNKVSPIRIHKFIKQKLQQIKKSTQFTPKQRHERNQLIKNKIPKLEPYKVQKCQLQGTAQQKLEMLQNKIINLMQYAKQNMGIINQLFNCSCVDNGGFQFKLILKYGTRQNMGPVDKLIHRLFQADLAESMNEITTNPVLKRCKTIQQWIKQEDNQRNKQIIKILSTKKQIDFFICDIIRGRCIFNRIQQIIKVITVIEQKIYKTNKSQDKNNQNINIKIIQIQNKISTKYRSIILKIKIKQLICQLQMVLRPLPIKIEISLKIQQILDLVNKKYSYFYAINQWNQKNMKLYFTLLENQFSVILNQQMIKYKQTKAQLQKYVFFNPTTLKTRAQLTKSKDITQLLRYINSIKIIKTKVQKAYQLTKLRTIQFFNQVNLFQKSVQLKDSLQSSMTNNLWVLSCQEFAIGQAYYRLSKYSQSLYFYGRSLAKRQQVKGKQDIQISSTLNNMGLVYKNMGKNTQAQYYFQKSLQIKQKIKGKYDFQCAMTRSNLAILYKNMGKLNQSLQQFHKGLQIIQKCKGIYSLEYANTLYYTAICQQKLQNYVQALKTFGRCLQIKQILKGEQDPDCLNVIKNIQIVYKRLGINKKQKQFNNIEYSTILIDIGNYFSQNEKNQQALKYFNEVLESKQQKSSQANPFNIEALSHIQSNYFQSGKYQKVLELSEKTLKVTEKAYGVDSKLYADQLNNIGMTYSKMGNTQQASKYFQKSLSIYQKVQGNNAASSSSALNNIAILSYKNKNYEQALKKLNKSLIISQKSQGKDNIQCAKTLNNLGLVYRKKKKYSQAIGCFERSLQLTIKIRGRQDIYCAYILNNIGSVYYYLEQYQNALEYYQKSLVIKQKIKGKDSPEYCDTQTNIEAISKILNNNRK